MTRQMSNRQYNPLFTRRFNTKKDAVMALFVRILRKHGHLFPDDVGCVFDRVRQKYPHLFNSKDDRRIFYRIGGACYVGNSVIPKILFGKWMFGDYSHSIFPDIEPPKKVMNDTDRTAFLLKAAVKQLRISQ